MRKSVLLILCWMGISVPIAIAGVTVTSPANKVPPCRARSFMLRQPEHLMF